MIVKTLLYTGVRVSELINIKLSDVDFHYCQIRINKGKGSKGRINIRRKLVLYKTCHLISYDISC
ncbi:tyrosine-type recombinase/integrase [Gordoniibacillus kamchatkensis]|uniref:tyrosine-type recombinase/integrase n=1 Tax=Gordoniibacillus kamchatkensis TaxID=1590651 RepID=UPI001E48D500|nr:tyrosine-type recombinase/integrase [Paenibacillus sp. VKM B-2647]